MQESIRNKETQDSITDSRILFKKTVRQEPERDIPEHRITFNQPNVNVNISGPDVENGILYQRVCKINQQRNRHKGGWKKESIAPFPCHWLWGPTVHLWNSRLKPEGKPSVCRVSVPSAGGDRRDDSATGRPVAASTSLCNGKNPAVPKAHWWERPNCIRVTVCMLMTVWRSLISEFKSSLLHTSSDMHPEIIMFVSGGSAGTVSWEWRQNIWRQCAEDALGLQ